MKAPSTKKLGDHWLSIVLLISASVFFSGPWMTIDEKGFKKHRAKLSGQKRAALS